MFSLPPWSKLVKRNRATNESSNKNKIFFFFFLSNLSVQIFFFLSHNHTYTNFQKKKNLLFSHFKEGETRQREIFLTSLSPAVLKYHLPGNTDCGCYKSLAASRSFLVIRSHVERCITVDSFSRTVVCVAGQGRVPWGRQFVTRLFRNLDLVRNW